MRYKNGLFQTFISRIHSYNVLYLRRPTVIKTAKTNDCTNRPFWYFRRFSPLVSGWVYERSKWKRQASSHKNGNAGPVIDSCSLPKSGRPLFASSWTPEAAGNNNSPPETKQSVMAWCWLSVLVLGACAVTAISVRGPDPLVTLRQGPLVGVSHTVYDN